MQWYWVVFIGVLCLTAGFIAGVVRANWVHAEEQALKASIDAGLERIQSKL